MNITKVIKKKRLPAPALPWAEEPEPLSADDALTLIQDSRLMAAVARVEHSLVEAHLRGSPEDGFYSQVRVQVFRDLFEDLRRRAQKAMPQEDKRNAP